MGNFRPYSICFRVSSSWLFNQPLGGASSLTIIGRRVEILEPCSNCSWDRHSLCTNGKSMTPLLHPTKNNRVIGALNLCQNNLSWEFNNKVKDHSLLMVLCNPIQSAKCHLERRWALPSNPNSSARCHKEMFLSRILRWSKNHFKSLEPSKNTEHFSRE